MANSCFDSIPLLPEDPILSLPIHFAADPRPQKVNLGIGAYADAWGENKVLEAVRQAEKIVFDQQLNKDYLPIEGNAKYVQEVLKLVYGEALYNALGARLFGAQSIGGTGALRIGGEFVFQNLKKEIFVSDPTWSNHHLIFHYTGLKVISYPYYDASSHQLAFKALLEKMQSLPACSVVLLHASCHNPTGINPSKEQWHILSDLFLKKQIIPFFDLAYQGLGSNLDDDAYAVRHFAREGHLMLVASSCSKNFGLYGERLGMLSIVSHHAEMNSRVASQIKKIMRASYSTPPVNGPRIIATLLQSKSLRNLWESELVAMRTRIQEMRKLLAMKLSQSNLTHNFDFMQHQEGLFSYIGLNKGQVEKLRIQYGIYMPASGRINVAGINPSNIDYVANALTAVLRGIDET